MFQSSSWKIGLYDKSICLHYTVDPSLRVKKFKAQPIFFEFSVNMDIRVIWFYEGESLVALVDIGHHDVLKNY